MKKNNDAWNLRHLVDESFVPSNQRTSVLYCKLSDFMSMLALQSWITIDFYEMTLVLASCHSVAKMDDFLSRMQATKQTDTWKLSVTILTENLVKLCLVKLRFWNFKSMSWVEADNGVNTFLKEHFHFSIMSNLLLTLLLEY